MNAPRPTLHEDMAASVPFTVTFEEISSGDLPRVGGKGANLGALTRAGIPVPPGYCITTRAFDRFIASLTNADALFAALDALDGTSVDAARVAAESMRHALEKLPFPTDVAAEVVKAWRALGTEHPLAVRSSATAEDLPGASFAGQQDTYLNVVGEAALLDAVRRCWISLFTDRAVLYRARGKFGHQGVRLSVVVQRLVNPEVSGILFTADPITGHRRVASIDAGFGLGEALVGGLISADLYRVDRQSGEVLLAQPGKKDFAIRSVPGGGTKREPLAEPQRSARALNDDQVRALAEIGGRVESHYGGVPQDIEWCIADGTLYIVQARPITSLFPIPDAPRTDNGLRIFLSFGHLQMMLDAMPRLAREVWQLFFPAGKDRAPRPEDAPTLSTVMLAAGGRLYLDVTGVFRVARAREVVLGVLGHVYEALGKSAAALANRQEFRENQGSSWSVFRAAVRAIGPVLARVPLALFFLNPVKAAKAFGAMVDSLPREAGDRIRAASTPGSRIRQSAVELNMLFSRVRKRLPWVLTGFIAHKLLGQMAKGRWADGVRNDVDVLMRGLPGNVTTQMDLAVGDLTDLVRSHAELADLLRTRPWPEARTRLTHVEGGPAFAKALEEFLARYGNRGASEIDISRARWNDDPTLLLRVITGGLSAKEAGGHRRQHQTQVAEGDAAAARLVAAAGPLRRPLIQRLTHVARIGMGLREHPKFIIVKMLGVVRAEILMAGELLAQRKQISTPQDVWHLGFDELANALDNPVVDLRAPVATRSTEFAHDQPRKPPIAISSDGEIPALTLDRADLPPGALPGTAASRGVVEGIARVVTDPEREVLHAGEILVAAFTDPGWTPLFVHAAGVVTEVGGMMTHGAVVAREYGIPAVVSVPSAVDRIKTGQRIRVDGTRGFVEILEAT